MAKPIAVRFAYLGSAFPNGYARQPEGGTVEDALLTALKEEGMVDGTFRTGSRTDKGVSALENVIGATLDRPHLKGLIPALQTRLPDGVWITGVAEVDGEWGPRHGAVRTYLYIAPAGGESLRRMRKGCSALEGSHDMRGFARLQEGRDPNRHVLEFSVEPERGTWVFRVRSPGFLWNQVRRMVDAVLCVGRGEAKVRDLHDTLRSGEPHPSFKVAPAPGLLLESVLYDPPLDWRTGAGGVVPRGAADALASSLVQAAVARHVLDRPAGAADPTGSS